MRRQPAEGSIHEGPARGRARRSDGYGSAASEAGVAEHDMVLVAMRKGDVDDGTMTITVGNGELVMVEKGKRFRVTR